MFVQHIYVTLISVQTYEYKCFTENVVWSLTANFYAVIENHYQVEALNWHSHHERINLLCFPSKFHFY